MLDRPRIFIIVLIVNSQVERLSESISIWKAFWTSELSVKSAALCQYLIACKGPDSNMGVQPSSP